MEARMVTEAQREQQRRRGCPEQAKEDFEAVERHLDGGAGLFDDLRRRDKLVG
jgi:hypothetical protein